MKADEFKGIWQGQTVVCIASGPSLTKQDCEIVKSSGLKTIVTNNTYELCSWADGLFAFDLKWWLRYKDDVQKSGFKGEKFSCSFNSKYLDIVSFDGIEWFTKFGNSGACAISAAIGFGAKKILILGYDCKKKDGVSHWHGEHPDGFSNCNSITRWPRIFEDVAKFARHNAVEVINCSRETALTCFEREALESAIQKN